MIKNEKIRMEGRLTALLKHRKVALFVTLFCMLLWGSAFPMLKVSYAIMGIPASDYLSKTFLAGLRFLLAGILGSVFYLVTTKGKRKRESLPWSFILRLAFFQTAFQYSLFYVGVGNTTGVKSAIIQASSTFFSVLLAHWFVKGDGMTKRKIIALILGFSGIVVANISKEFDMAMRFNGEGFLMISSLSNAIGGLLVTRERAKTNPLLLSSLQMGIGSLPLVAVGLLSGVSLQFSAPAFGLLIYGAFLSATAFALWYGLLQIYPLGEISIYRLFIPLFGSLLSVMLLPEETLQPAILIGLAFVVSGIYLLNAKKA